MLGCEYTKKKFTLLATRLSLTMITTSAQVLNAGKADPQEGPQDPWGIVSIIPIIPSLGLKEPTPLCQSKNINCSIRPHFIEPASDLPKTKFGISISISVFTLELAGILDFSTVTSEKASFLKVLMFRSHPACILSAGVISSLHTFHSERLLALLPQCYLIHLILVYSAENG